MYTGLIYRVVHLQSQKQHSTSFFRSTKWSEPKSDESRKTQPTNAINVNCDSSFVNFNEHVGHDKKPKSIEKQSDLQLLDGKS